jgi:hypothetical protein
VKVSTRPSQTDGEDSDKKINHDDKSGLVGTTPPGLVGAAHIKEEEGALFQAATDHSPPVESRHDDRFRIEAITIVLPSATAHANSKQQATHISTGEGQHEAIADRW